jgi:hypothetical protein
LLVISARLEVVDLLLEIFDLRGVNLALFFEAALQCWRSPSAQTESRRPV